MRRGFVRAPSARSVVAAVGSTPGGTSTTSTATVASGPLAAIARSNAIWPDSRVSSANGAVVKTCRVGALPVGLSR